MDDFSCDIITTFISIVHGTLIREIGFPFFELDSI